MQDEDNKTDQPEQIPVDPPEQSPVTEQPQGQSQEQAPQQQMPPQPIPRCVYCGAQPMMPTIYMIPGQTEDTRVFACSSCGAVINFQSTPKVRTAPLIAQAGSLPPRIKLQ